jgi:hypothetical protein
MKKSSKKNRNNNISGNSNKYGSNSDLSPTSATGSVGSPLSLWDFANLEAGTDIYVNGVTDTRPQKDLDEREKD